MRAEKKPLSGRREANASDARDEHDAGHRRGEDGEPQLGHGHADGPPDHGDRQRDRQDEHQSEEEAR